MGTVGSRPWLFEILNLLHGEIIRGNVWPRTSEYAPTVMKWPGSFPKQLEGRLYREIPIVSTIPKMALFLQRLLVSREPQCGTRSIFLGLTVTELASRITDL